MTFQTASRTKIWIDLENTPHIPLFNPIVRELRMRGYDIVITARDAYQTCEMADLYGFEYTRIGRHYGRHKFLKFLGAFLRTARLMPFVVRQKPDLALNHGSRTQNLACRIFGIPSMGMMDYEHTSHISFFNPVWSIFPQAVYTTRGHTTEDRSRAYSGIKEDVYAPDLKPDPSLLDELHLRGCRLIVTVRPPATEAHYHNPEAEVLFECFMNLICTVDGSKTILLPRNDRQKTSLISAHPEWYSDSRVVIPDGVVEGMNLLWYSDLVVSGGGTMNREAAALGVPVYSIFRGRIGAVDRALESEGRLILIENVADIIEKIKLVPRENRLQTDHKPRKALHDILGLIDEISSSETD